MVTAKERKQAEWVTEKGFEGTGASPSACGGWKASLKSRRHGGNQPGEEPRKDTQRAWMGLVCQRTKKQASVMGSWSGRGGASSRRRGQILWGWWARRRNLGFIPNATRSQGGGREGQGLSKERMGADQPAPGIYWSCRFLKRFPRPNPPALTVPQRLLSLPFWRGAGRADCRTDGQRSGLSLQPPLDRTHGTEERVQ